MPVSSVRPLVSSDSTRFGGKFKKLPPKSVDWKTIGDGSATERQALLDRNTQLLRETLIQNYPKHLQELTHRAHKTLALSYGDVLQVLEGVPKPLSEIAPQLALSPKEARKALDHLKEMGLVEQPHVFKFLRRSAMTALYKMLHESVEHLGAEMTLGEKPEKPPFWQQLNEVHTGYRVNRYGFVAGQLWKDRHLPDIAPAFQPPPGFLNKLFA